MTGDRYVIFYLIFHGLEASVSANFPGRYVTFYSSFHGQRRLPSLGGVGGGTVTFTVPPYTSFQLGFCSMP